MQISNFGFRISEFPAAQQPRRLPTKSHTVRRSPIFVVRASRPHFFDGGGIVQAGRLHHKDEHRVRQRPLLIGAMCEMLSQLPKKLLPSNPTDSR